MFDSHCHTNCSDGNISIEDRVRLILELGYEAATITDHDFISHEQVRRARSIAGSLPFVPGIELSLSHNGSVVHMLGYFIDPGHPGLQHHIDRVQEHDRQITASILKAFQRIEYQGKHVDFNMDDLESHTLHTFYSMQLVRRLGTTMYAGSPQSLLPEFLHQLEKLGLTYAEMTPWPVRDAIDLIHNAGGIAVLAHPGGRPDNVMQILGFLWHDEDIIRTYTDWGLDGIETRTPVHSQDEQQHYEELADRFHLLATSGSDCHGDDPYLGPALMGDFQNLYEGLYEDMLTALRNRQR